MLLNKRALTTKRLLIFEQTRHSCSFNVTQRAFKF